MNILSCNVNGIRSAYKKGLLDFIGTVNPDILCLQEIKVDTADILPVLKNVNGYHAYFHSAKKKGYSGVAVYTKIKPLSVNSVFGLERFDTEGRMLEFSFPDFTLINFYIPHGGRLKEHLAYKLHVYEKLFEKIESYTDTNLILIGDFNVAHNDIDIARPKENRDNIMYTPEERKQLDRLLSLGFTDTYRLFHTDAGHYTWWSYMFDARERNVGWRIDYCFVSQSLLHKVREASIYPDVFLSDHCPIGCAIDL